MKKELSAVKRLDMAAQALANDRMILVSRVMLLIVSPLLLLLTIQSEASRRETTWVGVLAGVACFTTLVLWSRSRYKFFALAGLCFAIALGSWFAEPHRAHSIVGLIAESSRSAVLLFWTCGLLVIARRYATVNSRDWQHERQQVAEWLKIIKNDTRTDIVQFSHESFWTGHWTYLLFNPGDCWVLARFKKGTTRLASCRVYRLDEVVIRETLDGRRTIEIGQREKKVFANVELTVGQQLNSLIR